MLTPLVDVDTNPRQPGFRATKEGSGIPNPPKFQPISSTDRRSPFSASTAESHSYAAMPATTVAAVSPTPASRLPRRSTPTQSAFSKSYTHGVGPATPRSSLPRSQGGLKHCAIAVPQNLKPYSPLSFNKPLPSPPIAHLVDPQSPPKAQRTLVDAEAGSPTEDQWPIIRPEDTSPAKTSGSVTNDVCLYRSVSEGSALRRNCILMPGSPPTTPLPVDRRTPLHKTSFTIGTDESDDEKFSQMTEPRTLSSTNPYAKSFHAFSTNSKVTIDSPLAHKRHSPSRVSIPPRISSKRTSLPLPDKRDSEACVRSTCDSSRSINKDLIKCPALKTAIDKVSAEQLNTDVLGSDEQKLPVMAVLDSSALSGVAPAAQSHYGSIDSISARSLTAVSSFSVEKEIDLEPDVRVKRLSCHPSDPDSGPTLRISADADVVLLGLDNLPPVVPKLPEYQLHEASYEQTLSTLAGWVSKPGLNKVIPSLASRSSTPSSGRSGDLDSKLVKITPIRSMQPPRKTSTGNLVKASVSPAELVSMQVGHGEHVGRFSPDEPCSSSLEPQDTPRSNLEAEFDKQTTNTAYQKRSYETGNYSTTLQNELLPEVMQGTDKRGNDPLSLMQTRLPGIWKKPKASLLSMKKDDTKRSNTSLLLLSTRRSKRQISASSTRSPSLASSNLAGLTPAHAGTNQSGPSRLGTKFGPSNESIGSGTIQHGADTATRTKAKRSLRRIFLRRDLSPALQPTLPGIKRSSVAGNALAQRIKNSTNFSKISLTKVSDTKADAKQPPFITPDSGKMLRKEADRNAALFALGSRFPDTSPEQKSLADYDTATVIQNILDHVTLMGVDSPDRLRGLEIAEAVLHAAECCKEAKLSAELARKHAHDAQISAQRAGIEVKRLGQLCESGSNDEALQAIKQLIKAAGVVEPPEIVVQWGVERNLS